MKRREEKIMEKIESKDYEVYGDKEKQKEALVEMMKNDQELGLYDEPMELSENDKKTFFDNIENPPAPNEELKEAASQYNEEVKKNEINSTTTNVETNEIISEEITDADLLKLEPDYSPRYIDIDGDGSVDGIDTDGDGIINEVTAHPNRAMEIRNALPYYARATFDWNDRKSWINDQNAVNYWIKHIKPSQYPTDFSSKSY